MDPVTLSRSWLEGRRLLNERLERGLRATRVQVGTHILRAVRQRDDLHRLTGDDTALRDHLPVRVPWAVGIRDHDDAHEAVRDELVRVRRFPLASATVVARRWEAQRPQPIHILFTFDNDDHLPPLKLRPPIDKGCHPTRVPDPAAVPV